ncbi:UDP-N-acetylmuramoyl-L-alanine--D-glutamate ligase [Marinilabiliaceae bacterium ANBcel2]|nr:UDP-N-acetylmuramoyl-L-alanine--D-glutamate ligase [Marinilabiliaceae bacterium ANBcel2]
MKKEIAVLGAGESGTAAALLAIAKGYAVFVSDSGKIPDQNKREISSVGIEYEEGGHSFDRILKATEVIKSPGIPDSAPVVAELLNRNIPVISDIEFAWRYSNAFIIGVTGSNGKTTTSLWLYELLSRSGKDVVLAGNIGASPCRTLIDSDPDYFVLEISSFQLDSIDKFKCDIAVLTNITPDHLNRYNNSFEKYIASKFKIVKNSTLDDLFILCEDDKESMRYIENHTIEPKTVMFGLNSKNTFVDGDKLFVKYSERSFEMIASDIALPGTHNLYNAMVVALVGLKIDLPSAVIEMSLSLFKGVEHRMEFCGEYNGVKYYNDSKATNVNSTWYALESLDKNVVWIAGGFDKGNDYSELLDIVKEKVRLLICMGVDNSKLETFFSGIVPVECTSSMKEVFDIIKKRAACGDVVLLSPACASFDLFRSYQERGDQFKNYIRKIVESS